MSLFDDRIVPGGQRPPGAARSLFSGPGSVVRAVGALCLVMVLGLLGAGSVGARQVQLYTGSFGLASSTTPNPYPLSKPGGIAVNDTTHDVYVTDPGNHRVEEFSASGEFLLAFGANVGGVGSDVCGDLVPCTAGTPGSTPGELTTPEAIAVDNSSGPSQGDVYVADTTDDVVSKFNSSGELIRTWGDEGQLTGSAIASPPAKLSGPFHHPEGIAIDQSGNLWVYSETDMYEFEQNGSFVTDWPMAVALTTDHFPVYSVAVNSNDDLYLVSWETFKKYVFEFDTAGEELGDNLIEVEHVDAEALTVDPADNAVYVAQKVGTIGEVGRYEGCPAPIVGASGFCEPTEVFGVAQLSSPTAPTHAVAEEPVAHRVYVLEDTGTRVASEGVGNIRAFASETIPSVSLAPLSSPTPSAVTLKGTIDPEGVQLNEGLEGCRFEWGETTSYGHVVACDRTAAEIGSGSAPVEVQASLSGLVAGTTYHFRLAAGNANDVNANLDEPSVTQDVAFGPASIGSESALDVSSSGVTLEAEVNPQDADTHVLFEYGTSTSYGSSTAAVDLGSGGTDQNVSEVLQGLSPNTLYHYRLVASSPLATVDGEDQTFITQRAGGALVLPDNREWELVSPPNMHGAEIHPLDRALSQAALSGDAVTYSLSQANEADAQGSNSFVQVISTRAQDGGWASKDIALPRAGAPDEGPEYEAFSEDLSTALVEPRGPFTSLKPEVFPVDSGRTPYVRHNSTCASEPTTCYAPIVTGAEGYEDVPPGTEFNGPEPGETANAYVNGKDEFVGGTPNLAHVIVASTVQLTETPTPSGVSELYEWSADKSPRERLALVSRLEDGQPSPGTAGLGGEEIGSGASGNPGKNAVSSDGSRIVWNEQEGGGGHGLYLTDTTTGQTFQLDTVQGGEGTGGAEPHFLFGSGDLSRIFFTDTQRLTSDSGAADDDPDLYECEMVEAAGALRCELHDLTPPHDGASASLPYQGMALGASEDGSWVYFAASGVLGETASEGARPGECEARSASATCNLYVMHDGASGWEAPRLVAVVSAADSPDWGKVNRRLGDVTARVSPNGEWLAFMSQRPLTGYDNRDAASGVPDEEVYLYHAGSTSRLICASCNPTGARPNGRQFDVGNGLIGNNAWGEGQWLAASVPTWSPGRSAADVAFYQSRYLSNSGRLFFDSSDALVPQDINDNQDVYEFEPAGVGSCSGESVTYGTTTEGCVSLISSGRAAGESAFIDASENGDDVFFLTQERLSQQDVGNAVALYDAHACTSALPCPSEAAAPPPCETAEACRAAPSPEPGVFGAPASATFMGDGNLALASPTPAVKPRRLTRAQKLARALGACAKKRNRQKRTACERTARKHYGSRKKTQKKTRRGK